MVTIRKTHSITKVTQINSQCNIQKDQQAYLEATWALVQNPAMNNKTAYKCTQWTAWEPIRDNCTKLRIKSKWTHRVLQMIFCWKPYIFSGRQSENVRTQMVRHIRGKPSVCIQCISHFIIQLLFLYFFIGFTWLNIPETSQECKISLTSQFQHYIWSWSWSEFWSNIICLLNEWIIPCISFNIVGMIGRD